MPIGRYQLVDVTPDGLSCGTRDINSVGAVLAYGWGSDNVARGMVWHNGAILELQRNTSEALDVRAINDDGLVVGSAQVRGIRYACAWRNGAIEFLEHPEGEWGSCAHAVNKYGVVVGFRPRKPGFDACVFWTRGQHTGAWRYTEFFPDFLPFEYSGGMTFAMGINDRHSIVGTVAGFGFLKIQDTYQRIGNDKGFWPNAANNNNVVVGYAVDPDETYAFRFESRVEDLPAISGSGGEALDINDSGLIVGASSYQRGRDECHGCVWHDAKAYDLNDRVENRGEYIITYASGINDAGQIAGDATLDGKERAVLLNPV